MYFAVIGVVVLILLYVFLFKRLAKVSWRMRSSRAARKKGKKSGKIEQFFAKERAEYFAKIKAREEAKKENERVPSPGSETTPDP